MKREFHAIQLLLLLSFTVFSRSVFAMGVIPAAGDGLPVVQDIRFNGDDTLVNGQFVVLGGDMKHIISIRDYHKPIRTTGPWRDCWLPDADVTRIPLQADRDFSSVKHVMTCNAHRAWLAEPVAWPCVDNPDRYVCEKSTDFAIYRWDKGKSAPERLPEHVRVPASYVSKLDPLLFCATEMEGTLAIAAYEEGDFGYEPYLMLLDANTGKHQPFSRQTRTGDIIAYNPGNGTLWTSSGYRLCKAEAHSYQEKVCAHISVVMNKNNRLDYRLVSKAGDSGDLKAMWLHFHLKHYAFSDPQAYVKVWMAEVNVAEHMRHIQHKDEGFEYDEPQLPFMTPGLAPLYLRDDNGVRSLHGTKSSLPLEATGERRYVQGSILNIRSQPHKSSGIVGRITIGKTVEVQFEEEGWSFINGTGYVPSRFLGKEPPQLQSLLDAYTQADSPEEKRQWAERAFLFKPENPDAYKAFREVLEHQAASDFALDEAGQYHSDGLPEQYNQRYRHFKYGCTSQVEEGIIIP